MPLIGMKPLPGIDPAGVKKVRMKIEAGAISFGI